MVSNEDKMMKERKNLEEHEESLSREEKVLEEIRDSLKGRYLFHFNMRTGRPDIKIHLRRQNTGLSFPD